MIETLGPDDDLIAKLEAMGFVRTARTEVPEPTPEPEPEPEPVMREKAAHEMSSVDKIKAGLKKMSEGKR